MAKRCLTLGVLAALALMLTGAAQEPHDQPLEFAQEYNQRAIIKWLEGDYTGALQDLNRAVEIDPDWDVSYNDRALVWAALGNYLAGLTDANRAVELAERSRVPAEELAANLDTRAYIYLKLGDYESALAEYDRTLGMFVDPQPESLLGRGLVLAALGEDVRAFTDFEAGLRFAALSRPNPQLVDLLIDTQLALPALRVPLAPDAFEPDDSPAQAKPLALDGWLQDHSLHVAGDADWVSFSLSAGQHLYLFTSSPTCDTHLSLYASDGVTVLADDDNSGVFLDSILDYTAPTGGVYYGKVRHADVGGTCAAYDLGATVSPLAPGRVPSGPTTATPTTAPPTAATPSTATSPTATPTATPRSAAPPPATPTLTPSRR